MRIFYVFLLLASVTITSFGQTKFKEGYFINNEDELVKCLIQDKAWLKNPTTFHYKLSGDGALKSRSIEDTKEFGVDSSLKYIRADVEMDMSPTDIDELSIVKHPLWEHKQVFLKVLVEGEAKLFYYFNGRLERFFYSVNDTSIQQLVYKEYYYEPDKRAYNNRFRQQLLNWASCPETNKNSIMNLRYYQKELERYFHQYNACVDPTYVIPKRDRKKLDFNAGVFTGFYISSVSAENNAYSYRSANFGPQLKFRLGVDVEMILPFNNNKWSLIFDSFYESYESQKDSDGSSSAMKYAAINVSLGTKYYLFLNNDKKFFLDIHVNHPVYTDKNSELASSAWYTDKFLEYPIDRLPLFVTFGGGFEYKNLYTGLRVDPFKDLLNGYPVWNLIYRNISLVVGYKLIRTKPSHSN